MVPISIHSAYMTRQGSALQVVAVKRLDRSVWNKIVWDTVTYLVDGESLTRLSLVRASKS